MFSVLDEKEKEIVVMAMEEKRFKLFIFLSFRKGDWVIK